jgi:hypothetical protein
MTTGAAAPPCSTSRERVIVNGDGTNQVAYQPPPAPQVEATPVPEAEPIRHVRDAFEADMQ